MSDAIDAMASPPPDRDELRGEYYRLQMSR